MKINKIAALISLLIFAYSCDIISPPYEEQSSNNGDDSTAKVVLLEEYTGFRCGNCPAAGEIAHKIKEDHPDNVVLLSIHAGQLASPTPQHKYDFRSQVMKDLDNHFNIGWGLGTPNGLVDRIDYNGNLVLPETDWATAVTSRLNVPASVKITMTPSFNTATKTISCEVKLKFLSDAPANYNLALYVVEDSIVQYQTDYRKNPIDVENFVHNNIIRDALTSTFGEAISDAAIAKGTEITKQYSKAIPTTADWRPEWIRLVAIVSDKDTYNVIQAGEKYILK